MEWSARNLQGRGGLSFYWIISPTRQHGMRKNSNKKISRENETKNIIPPDNLLGRMLK
jgi:hypothetical protein